MITYWKMTPYDGLVSSLEFPVLAITLAFYVYDFLPCCKVFFLIFPHVTKLHYIFAQLV